MTRDEQRAADRAADDLGNNPDTLDLIAMRGTAWAAAEIDMLQAELTWARNSALEWKEHYRKAESERERLTAENEKLRERKSTTTQVVIVHIEKNDAFPKYHVIGDDVRLFIVDENSPHDRVYEWLRRAPADRFSEIIPDGSAIGSQNDVRHEAIAARILGQKFEVVDKATLPETTHD